MNTKKLKKAILVILLLLFSISSLYLKYTFYDEKVTYVPYVVQSGDEIWNIAVECDLNQDIRKTVYEIRKINRLKSAIIYPGQEILVPVVSK